jgi:hypothetical protein
MWELGKVQKISQMMNAIKLYGHQTEEAVRTLLWLLFLDETMASDVNGEM